MCIGIPARVVSIAENSLGVRMATVDYAGSTREVCLEYVPEAGLGDHVIVHMGFAVSRLTAQEAAEASDTLDVMRDLSDSHRPMTPTERPGD